jgi:hypothetical protein
VSSKRTPYEDGVTRLRSKHLPSDADIPVACMCSGAIYTLDRILEGSVDTVVTVRGKLVRGEISSVEGRPCGDCRFQPTSSNCGPKLATCTYRLLQGPLFVPRQPGG